MLVSEVMLQQTRVEAMLPRYLEFVRRFPDVETLAAASEDAVLAAFSGLGYYARARSLRRAARIVVDRPDGFPRTAPGLGELPGIGEYTAAAVASIAFGQPVAAVDGNVRRVFARRFAIPGNVSARPFVAEVRRRADEALAAATGAGADPGEWNQALMELGALVCTPVAPGCDGCPLRRDCRARVLGTPDRFPARRPRRPKTEVRLAVGAALNEDGRVLVVRRGQPPLRGLFELPGGECRAGESGPDALVREAWTQYGLRLRPVRALPAFRQTVVNRRITVLPFVAEIEGPAPAEVRAARGDGAARPPEWRRVRPEAARSLPASSMLAKTCERLGTAGRGVGRGGESGSEPVDTLPAGQDPPA